MHRSRLESQEGGGEREEVKERRGGRGGGCNERGSEKKGRREWKGRGETERERERVGVDSSTFVCAGLQFFIGLW